MAAACPFIGWSGWKSCMGIPLPAATQWEVVEEAAEVIKPAHDELIRQAAQGEVLHNDDTSMRVLRLEREPSDERTGVFTSGIVAITAATQKIALYFTGRQHAGENMADVLKQRARNCARRFRCAMRCRATCRKLSGRGDPAGQLSGARKAPVCGNGAELPRECRYVLEVAGRGLLQRCAGA